MATALHIFLQHSQCELKNQCSTYMYECINKSLSASNYTLLTGGNQSQDLNVPLNDCIRYS